MTARDLHERHGNDNRGCSRDRLTQEAVALMVRLGLPGILVESFTFQEHTNCFRGAGYVPI